MNALLLALGTASAGDLYINGVRADQPPVITMEGVNVRFDEAGNIWIDAPLYRVTVVQAAPPPAPAAPATAPASSGVAAGVWWLVTEDNDSVGQDVEVLINGVSVRHIRSGAAQLILDVGPWLRPGANEVSLVAAPGRYDGGALMIYIGRGTTTGGTVRMDTPEVRYTRRSVDLGSGASSEFTIQVP